MTTSPEQLSEQAAELATLSEQLREKSEELALQAHSLSGLHGGDFFLTGLTIFMLACFVGYYVVWKVTPALHSPLMSVSNAISSVVIVGAMIALGTADAGIFSKFMGFLAVTLASINIFGGFVISNRMLSMFKKKA